LKLFNHSRPRIDLAIAEDCYIFSHVYMAALRSNRQAIVFYSCDFLFIHSLLLARQASAGRLMLCRCYFLSHSFFFFFSDHLEQRDLGNYKTDLRQIFRDGRHVGVDVQSGIGFWIGQGTLP